MFYRLNTNSKTVPLTKKSPTSSLCSLTDHKGKENHTRFTVDLHCQQPANTDIDSSLNSVAIFKPDKYAWRGGATVNELACNSRGR